MCHFIDFWAVSTKVAVTVICEILKTLRYGLAVTMIPLQVLKLKSFERAKP